VNQRVRNRSRTVYAYTISEDEKALEAMTEQCNKVGEELINAPQRAKVQGAHKRWKGIRQALKSVLGRGKIQDLYERLKQYQEQIVVVLLVITSAKQTAAGRKYCRASSRTLLSLNRGLSTSRDKVASRFSMPSGGLITVRTSRRT
jgi:hypothetical protein